MLYRKFWQWYEDNYTFNVGVATGLFLLQILHLIWLFGEVIWFKLTGFPLFSLYDAPRLIIILVDYTEIPAILSVSAIYLNELRKHFDPKNFFYLLFLNLQWLHLFWITDEFLLQTFAHKGLALPWLAWLAILIDYLELPVILDTVKKFLNSLRGQGLIIWPQRKN